MIATAEKSTTLAKRRCAYHDPRGTQCDLEATHRIVLLLSDANQIFVKKIILAKNGVLEGRCLGHQAFDASGYFDTEAWEKMASSYARAALDHGRELFAVRGLTRVQFEPEDMLVGRIPILAARPDGQLEEIGKARLIK